MDKKRLFVQNNEMGYYDPFCHYIMLNSIEQKEMKEIFDNISTGIYTYGNFEKLSTLAHEIRHWTDHLGTLDGLGKLMSQYKAIESWLNRDEFQFQPIKEYCDLATSSVLDDYFFELYKEFEYTGLDNRWIYEYSSGLGFDNSGKPDETQPIFFNVFSNKEKERLVRLPLTRTSIWEMNARFEQYLIIQEFLTKFPERMQWYENLLLKSIYSPELVQYSGAVHTYANIMGETDIFKAYKHGSAIGSFLLNLPKDLFPQIEVPEDALETWGERTGHFLKNKNIGFSFYCILHYINKNKLNIDSIDSFNFITKNLFDITLDELNTLIQDEYKNSLNVINNPTIGAYFESLVNRGLELNATRGILGQNKSSMEFIGKKSLPPILYGDTEKASKSFEGWWHFARDLQNRFVEFNKICGLNINC